MFGPWFKLVFAVLLLNLLLDNAARAGTAPAGVWGGTMERWLQNCGKHTNTYG